MNTFLGVQDYQWVAVSSIATALGVLTALIIPMINRHREKNNLFYFQAKSMLDLLSHYKYIKNLTQNIGDDKKKLIILKAKQLQSMELTSIDAKSEELAKYDKKLYEAIIAVTRSIHMLKDSAKIIIDTEEELLEEVYCSLFELSFSYVDSQIILNSTHLCKKKIIPDEWASNRV